MSGFQPIGNLNPKRVETDGDTRYARGNPVPPAAAGNELAGLLLGLLQPQDPLQDVQQTIGEEPSIDERISTIVTDILPSYIGEDHPTFVLFMKSFYEYLEYEGEARYEAVKLQTNFDIDQTLDSFVQYFMSQYASDFPETLDSGMSNRQLVKRINEFYKEKGGTISVSLLFRILFGKEADIDFPRERLFKISGGDYLTSSIIKLSRTNTVSDLKSVEGGILRQYPYDDYGAINRYAEPFATALIDSVAVTKIDGINQTTINLKTVNGNFTPNREVELVKGSTLLQEHVFELIGGITISDAGVSYDIGDSIEIKDSRGFVIASSSVRGINRNGSIKTLEPVRIESIYRPYETYSFDITSSAGVSASLSFINGYGNLPSRKIRRTAKSTASSKSVIPDHFRNQQHSYVIRVEEQLKTFKQLVLDIIHPAGSRMFNDHVIDRKFSATTFDFVSPQSSTTSSNPTRFTPAIGHFTPYIFSGTFDLRGDTFGSTYIDYYPTGFNGLTMATIGTSATHDPITAGFTIGAMGGPSAGTQNPEAFGYTFSVNAGVTLPGYTVENINQKIQVTGTDSITAPFWIIYKHPKNTLINPPASGLASSNFVTIPLDPAGFTAGHFTSFTAGMTTGDVIVQRSSSRQTAIGIVSGITSQNPRTDPTRFASSAATLGIVMTINVRNGEFTNESNSDGTPRLLLNTRNSATFDTLGTGGNLSIRTAAGTGLNRFAWTDLVIGDFLNTTIY